MNISKYLIAFFLFFSLSSVNSQENRLTITSNSGDLFLIVNNIIQNTIPADSLHLNQISEGSYHIKILNTEHLVSAEKTIFINNDQHLQYEHYIEDSLGFIRLIGNYPEIVTDSLLISYSFDERLPIDSIYKYTLDTVKTNALLYPTDYFGKKGCALPRFINTQKITQKVESQLLTRKKKEVILRELKNQCIQVDDLNVILKTIEYEDSKLNLIKLLSSQIFDIENLGKLDNLFNIRGYQDSFNEFKQSF